MINPSKVFNNKFRACRHTLLKCIFGFDRVVYYDTLLLYKIIYYSNLNT